MPDATTTDSLPVYKAGEVPEHLRTMTQLKADRLKPAEGQEPVGFLSMYRRGHGWGKFPLYDPAGAAKMRPLSARQQQAMTERRTCPRCHQVRQQPVYRQCSACDAKDREDRLALQARTCWKCRRVSVAALRVAAGPGERDRCVPCWVLWRLQQQFEAERLAVWRRTCPGQGCAVVTATDEEIAAERAAKTWLSPRWCPPCAERDTLERVERQRQAEENARAAVEARRQQVAALEAWAREVLADPGTVILDTETTGLEDDARIVDIAVQTVAGDILMDTLVNPGEPIPNEATGLHGITDAQVAAAPRFADILVQLAGVLEGRRCLIYNKPYDVARLHHELTLHYRQTGHAEPEAAAAAWMSGMRFEDAMIPYSDWVGDWSDYWGNYAWQPLYGGDHRALGDCRAVVERLREMTARIHEGSAG
ncbi:Exonuclease RNase T and DNA polymerase III [Actinobacteria bacterium OV320]|nr:Exonuclease RNase T and DNA polymerase III [Actinobacteria bacterium OV320]